MDVRTSIRTSAYLEYLYMFSNDIKEEKQVPAVFLLVTGGKIFALLSRVHC